MTVSAIRATLDDLMATKGKAELIGGRIVKFMPMGFQPSQVSGNIYSELRSHVRRTRIGVVCMDNQGFAVPELPSGRESFSPDVSYYTGPLPVNLMKFISGAPTFAVEVRSENDYGKSAEAEISAKRDDYFVAGTLVVWDVDPLAESIHVFRATDPARPTIYRRGDQAEAEPAVPGWRVPVDEVFTI